MRSGREPGARRSGSGHRRRGRRWATRLLAVGLMAPAVALAAACGGGDEAPGEAAGEETPATATGAAETDDARDLLALWGEGVPGFGVYVPQEQYTEAGAAQLATNPLYDYLFLNLEGSYDPAAVQAVSAGVAGSGVETPPTLLVRIPPMSEAGVHTTGQRVEEILAAGADGVVLPHIRNLEEARTAVGFFQGRDVWSPANPDGTVVAMIMLEDPDAIAQLDEIVALGGYSVLACGVGSLAGALDGDRERAETMCQGVLEAATAAGYADMMTADADNVADRVEAGYLAVLTFGAAADSVILRGREAAGR